LKLLTYSRPGEEPRIGYFEDGRVRQMAEPGISMLEFIEHGREPEDRPDEDESLAMDEVELHAPLGGATRGPQKILGIGLNYRDHAEETGAELPEKPILFAKYANTIAAPGEAISIPPITEQADYEAELGVVIGRPARNVSAEEALDHVFGYVACNDVSTRDLQFSEGGQWTRSKSIDTFFPIGPYIATADEVPDPQNLSVRCVLNGETMQDGNTSDMIFPVSELIAFLSTGMTLMPGDIISTGTPAGVGTARDPKVFLGDGDEVTVEIQGLGTLTNPVRAE
jgi:2-keto-4-pentenoate hydratase/2-oxohepta-3-ene-1,7-dioic acid hydratase in catechol pathway